MLRAMSKRYGTVEDRFWKAVRPQSDGGCWLWHGPRDEAGYARMRIGKRKARMHRWSYERFNGPIPEGMFVCHRCDVPGCVNPAHLFLGTMADNVADKVAKRRQAVGRQSPHAKLTEADILAIREANDTHRSLGRRYGVTHGIIGKIKRREDWKHVP